MKHFKKFFSYLVALTMVLSLAAFTGVKVHAAGETTYTLTLKNEGRTSHTFEVYQIFIGDLSGNTLSNIQWGSGITEAGKNALGTAATKAESLSGKADDSSDAKEFAESLQNYLTAGKEVSVDANSSAKVEGLKAGYYLVKDKAGEDGKSTQNDKEYGATTSYILKVVKDVEAKTKLDVPTVVKKVKDTNASTGNTSDWQDSADYDIGDDVPYQVTGTMPANIADYTTYKYTFTDTMSKGLTYTANNAKITIGDKDVTSSFTEKVTTNTDGSTTVTWACDNLKGIDGVTLNADTKVVVNYTAKLNKYAALGAPGNPNEVDLTYSNNPNKGGEGETGKTPKDKNIVFTYKVVVNKVNENTTPLAGAEFTLSKVNADNTTTVVKTYTITGNKEKDPTTFTATGLDDGTYVLKETKTPAGYNTIADQYFTISASHETDSADPKLTSLSGDKLTGSAQTTITFTADKDAGSLTTDVVNKKGSTLPSTGGMGTTLLYVAGGILVACAAAYVVISRKHSTNK